MIDRYKSFIDFNYLDYFPKKNEFLADEIIIKFFNKIHFNIYQIKMGSNDSKWVNEIQAIEEIIVNNYDKLIYKHVNKWRRFVSCNVEDLYQELRLVVVKSIRKFNPLKGTPFYSYIESSIRNTCCDFAGVIEKINEHEEEICTKDEFGEYTDTITNIIDYNVISPDRQYEYVEIINAISQLNPKEQMLIRQYFYESKTYEEIAKGLHCSRQNSFRIMIQSFNKIRNILKIDNSAGG